VLEFGMQGGGVAATLGAWGADPSEISAKFRWKSTADPPENKQTNQPQIPRGNQMQIPKQPQLSGTNLNLKNNWRSRVIELTILSQMHFSEFNLDAWLCMN
jgi:hypothetical protein